MLKIPAGMPASRSVALLGRSLGVNLTAPVRISIVLRVRPDSQTLDQTIRRLSGIWPNPSEIEILPTSGPVGDMEAQGRRSWRFPFLRSPKPLRSTTDNAALAHARGQFVLLLDEEVLPSGAVLRRMMEHFRANPRLGAAVFALGEPDGTQTRPEFPDMILGGATAFRRRALDLAGFFAHDLLTPAAEYDLSLRLIEHGWQVRRFDDLSAMRLGAAPSSASTTNESPDDRFQLETCEELLLIARRFPWRWILPYAMDWMQRRRWTARRDGQYARFRAGFLEGLLLAACTPRRAVSGMSFESFTRIAEIERRMRQAVQRLGLRRVVLINAGRNLYAYHRAAQRCGLQVVAIADNRLAAPRRHYRNIRVVNDDTAQRMKFDAAIVADPSDFASARRLSWAHQSSRPLLEFLVQAEPAASSPDESSGVIAGRITPDAVGRAEAAARRIAARSA